jgi:GNAT superfamily N-acetyltransferase
MIYRRFVEELHPNTIKRLKKLTIPQGKMRDYLEYNDSLIYIYKTNKIIGWAICRSTNIAMYVDPNYRKKGIATKLMKAIEKDKEFIGYVKMFPFNKHRKVCNKLADKFNFLEVF